MSKISCIGAGYVGGTTMSVIAKMCPDITVYVADINEDLIEEWCSDHIPIYEPGLQDIVSDRINKNLFFTTNIKKAIEESDIIFIAVNTPTKMYGIGSGMASDISNVIEVCKTIAKWSNTSKVIVEKSTVPVTTSDIIKQTLEAHKQSPDINFHIVSNPEFLAEGTAVNDLLQPDRILIGGNRGPVQFVVDIYAHWVPIDRIITTDVFSSELTKLVANAFLAQRVTSINSISLLCEKTGANIKDISKVIGMDARIGSKFLNPSIAFGGSCFRKDILNLIYIAEYFNLPEVADYWRQVIKMNEHTPYAFVKKILNVFGGSIRNKKIALLGYAFKSNTCDVRETPAKPIIELLIQERAIIHIYDPQAKQLDLRNECTGSMKSWFSHVIEANNAMSAVTNADAIVILTEWPEFKALDYSEIAKVVNQKYIFDGRLLLDKSTVESNGFHYFGIGV